MTGQTRSCGHPLGNSRWCPTCEYEGMQADRKRGPATAMKCFKCDASAPTVTLYRVNAKGRPAVWACNAHRIEPDMDLDVTIAEIERMRRGHAIRRKTKPTTPGGGEGGK